MCWKESDRVSERLEFVKLASVEGANITVLCERFNVSRKTGYKWLNRWKDKGQLGLEDRSRCPINSPLKTTDEMEAEVLALRAKHPKWGGRKLHKRLITLGCESVPSPSTITKILGRHGLISEAESSKHKALTRFERGEANELWQIDFKGDFRMCNGKRCYPLTILDDYSRYSLAVLACGNQKRLTVQGHFRNVFAKYGIPRAFYVDNGTPWGTSHRRTRHTRLSTWLMRQDIQVIHGRPFHPQGRGKLERFHRTLKLEVLQDRILQDLGHAQTEFDPWRTIYNHDRPHEALGFEVPSTRYEASSRSFLEQTDPFEYSSRFLTRRTNPTGQFSFNKNKYRISDAFTDQAIGLSPAKKDGIWEIYYCRFQVGILDEHTLEITYASHLIGSRCAQSDQMASEKAEKQ